MLKLLFYIFLGWLLYKLVFDFFIPVYRGTKQVRRQVRDMQDAMRQQFEQQQQQQGQQQQAPPRPAEPIRQDKKGDYIDFEEIKN
ncbi:hypothetical protein [Chitinophaga barathri]|uniref:DUF4834 family protein n=1 Tax=Chitinophaga barathri TaxID=1647451 RepID=A0A3N4MAS4_9BACT|nr:hypothetical protein [Chitinophaga barathri]RPD38507.1 hypothetical protein EG028_24890 [Chitinophaga barathri]